MLRNTEKHACFLHLADGYVKKDAQIGALPLLRTLLR